METPVFSSRKRRLLKSSGLTSGMPSLSENDDGLRLLLKSG